MLFKAISACLLSGLLCLGQRTGAADPAARVAELVEAAKHGDERTVRTLLGQGVKGYVDSQGRSALHEAAAAGHAGLLKLLLAAGGDPNFRNGCGETPLHLAASTGRVDVAKLLLTANAQPNIKTLPLVCRGSSTQPGDTPLHGAVRSGHAEIMRDLITAKADVRFPNSQWMTPLFIAVSRNDVASVDALLKAGADVHLPARDGRTPLAQAASACNVELMDRLMALHADPNAADLKGITPLMLAAVCPSPAAARLLLSKGADPFALDGAPATGTPNPADPPRRNALMYAAEAGSAETAVFVADALKTRPTVLQASMGIALAVAAAHKKPAVIRELLARGAPVNALGNCRRTPLLNAANMGDLESVKLLLGKGADANAAESVDGAALCLGNTPLIEAAFNHHTAVVQALLEAGANVNKRNAAGWNAIDALRMSASATLGAPPSSEDQALLTRMRQMSASHPPPYAPGETPVFRSKALLWAVGTLAEPKPSDAPPVAETRARIATLARDLMARWPTNTWQGYGVVAPAAGNRPRPFAFNEYDRSLSLDLVLMDHADRGGSPAELLPLVAEDLNAKLKDCLATGIDGGPEERVSFVFRAMKGGQENIKGYRLRYADRKLVGLSMIRKQPIEFLSSPNPSESAVKLQPGTYWMFITDESSDAKTLCEKVEVGKHVELARTFNAGAANKGNECRIR